MGSPIALTSLASSLRAFVKSDHAWTESLEEAPQLHLAVLVQPYLDYILQGKKTVESRFGLTRGLPFGRVHSGDVIVLKLSSGPVVGMARASGSESMSLSAQSWPRLHSLEDKICADEAFWEERRGKRYATIVFLDKVRRVPDLDVEKTDRRGWVLLRSNEQTTHSWNS